jgi:glutamate carboxypeptidase
MDALALLDHLHARRGAILDVLADLVGRESPSRDKGALDALASVLTERLRALGGEVERIENARGGDHLRARFEALGENNIQPPVLVLGHFDTVWPLGTLDDRPFAIEDGRAFGPGVFDMKASLVLLEFAIEAIRALDLARPRPIVVLWTSDEEIGSPTSRRLIEEQATESAFVLVLESPLPGGRLKTARKGVGQFTVTIKGRAAHAGIEPEKGVSAIQELAHQILILHRLGNLSTGTTVNVGVVQGGTTPNVVAAQATARVDVRVTSLDEARRIEEAMGALRPATAGARVSATGLFTRPPMERTAQVVALFEQARSIGRSLGLELDEGSTGGASDGNFTAALGVPTLDGLGAEGDGAHAEGEHILIDSLPERAALLASLLLGLTPPGRATP